MNLLGPIVTKQNAILTIPIGFTILGTAFAGVAIPSLAPLIPGLFFAAALCNVASAYVVLDAARPEERSEARMLASYFALGAAATFVLSLITPISSETAPTIGARGSVATLVYAVWHLGIAGLAIVYGLRFRPPPHRDSLVARLSRWLCGLGLAAGCLILEANMATLEPAGRDASTAFEQIVGPIVLLFVVLGTGLLVRLPGTAMNRTLTISMVAIAMDLVLLLVARDRYSVARYVGRLLIVLAGASAFVSLVRSLSLDRLQLRTVEARLDETTVESGMRAAQFRALWQAASVDRLDDHEFFQTITSIGSANLRSGHPLYGYVSQREGDDIVIEAVSFCGAPYAATTAGGEPSLVSGNIERRLADARSALIWNGTTGEPDTWTCAIGTPIAMGTKMHFLVFASTADMRDRPFTESDLGFVEVLGSQIAHRYYQQDQFARLRYQLEHDSLTGLFNTVHFRKELRSAIAHRRPLAVARLNLDRFGEINTSRSHVIGDEILVEVAAMLGSVQSGDLVARLSGDDFVVVMYGVSSDSQLSERVSRYAAVFDKPFHTGDRDGADFMSVTCSFGAALFPRDGHDYEELMRCADVSLSGAKAAGGSTVVIFSDALRAAEQERSVQRREIEQGLANDAFVLEYQPTFDLATGHIVGAEALIRWNHPTRGRLLPNAFIPAAMRDGLIGRLTLWVVHRLFSDLRALKLPRGFRCYMNAPANVIDNEQFLASLERELTAAPRLQHHLGVEITETEAMQNVDKTIVALQAIRRRGLRVAIDDFGTGYSSLAYLKRLPVDMVKLDRAFVDGLPDDPKDVSVTELFLGLTERMEVTSLAEGIETAEQAEWLRSHGCAIGQGFLMSPPVPVEALPALFRASAHDVA